MKIPNHRTEVQRPRLRQPWAMPNFYFHLTMAYAILRHNGIELGKRDFLIG